jgi:hypothetical protein
MTSKNIEQSESIRELTSDEMAKVHGGTLFEACCKGTHIPNLVIEL